MTYNKTTWADRQVQYPMQFSASGAVSGTVTLTPNEGTITTAGTPITSANLNNIENGVANNDSRLTTVEGKYFDKTAGGTVSGNMTVTGTITEGSTLLSQKYVRANVRLDIEAGFFFTNGGATSATANITWGTAFTSAPHVSPLEITLSASYIDTIIYPWIYNITTTGCSVRLQTYKGDMLGTAGTPTNAVMWFMAIGN